MSVGRVKQFISGSWVDAEDSFDVRSPIDDGLVATVARADKKDVDRAVESALVAVTRTPFAPAAVRAQWCQGAARAIESRSEELALAITREEGKPLVEARLEVAFAVQGMECFQREALKGSGETLVVNDPNKRVLVLHQARGVWAVLTPWNFPVNIPIEYLGPAIATGSPVVWKPAPTTTAVAALLLEILLEGGVPPELVSLVHSDDVALAQHLVTHPGIACVGLTGGPNAGRAVAQAAWDKHLLLELGGNGPAIVFSDADIEKASAGIAVASFFNAGQVCAAAGRVLAHSAIADDLAAAMSQRTKEWPVGNPTEEGIAMGPLHMDAILTTVNRHVRDAIDRGAKLINGGGIVKGMPTSRYYCPTVLDEVPVDSLVSAEETFGPVVAIVRQDDDDELLETACRTRYGLACSVFTESVSRAFKVAERMPSGTVVVNDASCYWEHNLSFGGWAGTLSGRGRLGGGYVFGEFTQSKTVSFDIR
jgi:acyl-CoA reductase-like NAD-dependent aldehyde dehydrogenase